jgi:phosphoribosyl 1,2-cyclic phosphodiesterase
MHDISVAVLSSGSCGNSILIRSDSSGIIVDAGLSCRELDRRLSVFGVESTQIEALVLTHEHTDHTRGARRFCLEHKIPVFATRGTIALTDLDGVDQIVIKPGKSVQIGGFIVEPFKVRHLAAEPVALSVSVDSRKIGIASDLGSVTQEVVKEMSGSDLMMVEANYDEEMLLNGDYPDFLKRAIRGDHGHLSNDDAATLSTKASCEETKTIVLVHLSKENNTPEKALDTVRDKVKHSKHRPSLEVTQHGSPGGPYRLS